MPEESNVANEKPKPGAGNAKPTPSSEEKEAAQPRQEWLERLAAVVGILVLISFGVLILYMIWRAAPATELEWTRVTFLFGSVEAIAFTAAGFIFGREVNRQRAERAEEQADEASDKADEAKDETNEAKAKKEGLEKSVRLWMEGQTGAGGLEAMGAEDRRGYEQLNKILKEWA